MSAKHFAVLFGNQALRVSATSQADARKQVEDAMAAGTPFHIPPDEGDAVQADTLMLFGPGMVVQVMAWDDFEKVAAQRAEERKAQAAMQKLGIKPMPFPPGGRG